MGALLALGLILLAFLGGDKAEAEPGKAAPGAPGLSSATVTGVTLSQQPTMSWGRRIS